MLSGQGCTIIPDTTEGEAMSDAHWLRIYRRLAFFGGCLPVGVVDIQERYVEDYHKLLIELEHLSGLNLEDYFINEHYLKPVKISRAVNESQTTYSSHRFIDKHILLSKFRALGNYFDQKFAEY